MYVTPVDPRYRQELQQQRVSARVALPASVRVQDASKHVQRAARRWVRQVSTEKQVMRLSVCAAKDHMILKQFRFRPQLHGGGITDVVSGAVQAATKAVAAHPVAAVAAVAAATAYAVHRRKGVRLDEAQVRAVFANAADGVREDLGVDFEFKSVVLKEDAEECLITFAHNGREFGSEQQVGLTTQHFVGAASDFLKSELRALALKQLCATSAEAGEEAAAAQYPFARDEKDDGYTVVACSPSTNAVVQKDHNKVKYFRHEPPPPAAAPPLSDEDDS